MRTMLDALTRDLVLPSAPDPEPRTLRGRAGTRIDPYWYLRSIDDPRTQHVIATARDGFAALAERLAPAATRIEQTIRSRVVEPDESYPVRRGSWRYLSRIEPDLDYPVHYREPAAGGPRELVLDENAWARDHAYFALAGLLVGDDEHTVVIGVDTDGSEQLRLVVGRLEAGTITRAEELHPTGYGFVLSNDSRTLLYTRPDETLRPASVWAHRIGSDPSDDVLVLEEPDAHYFLDVGRTKDRSFLTIQAESKRTSQWWLLDATDPLATTPRPFAPREEGRLYQLDRGPDGFYLIESRDDAEFRLLRTSDPDQPLAEVDLLEDGEILEGFEITRHGLAIQTRRRASLVVSFLPWGAPPSERRLLVDPEQPSTAALVGNLDLDDDEVRFETVSLVEPATIWSYAPTTQTTSQRWRQRVGGDVNLDDYETRRLWLAADDGALIPVTIARHRTAPTPGPTLVYAYGAYEEAIDPTFSISRLSLLDAGITFAIAHVRGGGELGRSWYDAGRLEHKERTVQDLLDVVDGLVAQGIADPTAIAIRGASAGGITIGAALNRAPERFAAAVLEVPFVDCLTTMSDPSLPLTVTEWEEWGNPLESDVIAEAMARWSPYDNLHEAAYPPILVTTGLNDVRVGFFEPLKYVAKLRLVNPGARVWIRIDDEQGHLGPTKRKDAWRDEAQVLAFLQAALTPAAD